MKNAPMINSGKTDMESVDFLARQEKPEAGGKIVGTTATMLRAQVKADMLGRGLERLFGPVPPAVLERLAEASEEALDAWFDKALEAKSLEEVFGGAD